MATKNQVDLGLSGSTGTGNFVGANTPTLITPILGVATATSIVFSPTTSGLIGTTTNDNAAAGKVGEFISSTIASASSVTVTSSAAGQNLTSISLTAGDWDVWGNIFISTAGSITVNFFGCISTISATLGDNSLNGSGGPTITSNPAFNVPGQRISLSGSSNLYLVMFSSFSGTQPAACGGIYARRAR